MIEEAPGSLDELFCGNEAAIALWKMLHYVSHFYDDLIDQDKPMDRATIHSRMWMMLVEMQDNAFYCEHYLRLKPLIVNALIAYRASVRYEEENDAKGLELGHVLRYNIGNVMINMMYLCGGKAHVDQYAPAMYKRLCNETLDEYLDEMTREDDHVD